MRLLLVSGTESPTDVHLSELAAHPEFGVDITTSATACLDRLGPDIDCVVAVDGDGLDAVGLLERVRKRRPGVPFVLVGDSSEGSRMSRAIAADVSEFVVRTDADRLLLERVRATLRDVKPVRADGATRMPIADLGLREELRLKERAIDEAPVGITIADANQPDEPMIYVNDAFERLTGYSKAYSVGRNCRFLQGEKSDPEAVAAMREAVEEGESVSVELVNYREDGEPFWNRVDIAPVHDESGEVTHFVGFQMDITERKEAERKARRERQNLEHLLVRIDGLVQDVTRELVRAERRADIESALCECVVAADTYEFAWVGVPDRPSNVLVSSATAGEWTPPPASLGTNLSGTDPAGTARAYETGQMQITGDAETLSAIAAETPGIPDALRGVAAIPLVYGETVYGVLTLYTTESEALTDHEMAVLGALGRATGTAINALERGRLLATDDTTELEVRTETSELFFVDVSERTGATLEYDGSVYREDGSVLMFFRSDLGVERMAETAEPYPHVADVDPIHEGDDETLFQFELTDTSITATLSARGAKIRDITVADGVANIEITLPSEADVRGLVETLEAEYPGTEIVARRDRERPPSTRQEFVSEVEERLTERQLTALRKAHVSGFYEWNRRVTGDALAESMDIGRSTFHQHLRAAERKVIGAFFER